MNKVVLITGASAGIGEATALRLAREGYTVYGAARRLDKQEQMLQSGIKLLSMDVTKDESMQEAIKTIIAAEGRIDVLINNAGYGSYGAIEDVSMKEARYQLEVNIFGAARMIQLVLPHMRDQKAGKIINISSVGGKIVTPFGGWYHASKFALEGLSDALRIEVKPFGIDVIVMEPGGINTEWGGIAMDSLNEVSGKTAYSGMVSKMSNSFETLAHKMPGPDLIAGLISKALGAKRPKTRYVAGYMAKPAIIARKLLSDRMMDKMVMSQMK